MYHVDMFKSKQELRDFVAGLRIPESRRTLVELELLDHLESRIAVRLAAGDGQMEAEQNAFAALGDPEALRSALERVEPAFEIDPVGASARGLASAVGASIVFAIAGALFPRGDGLAANLAFASTTALCGLFVIWIVAPRGIGAALRSGARASIEPRARRTARQRAVKGYVGSMILVSLAVWAAWLFVGLPERVRDDLLWPASLLWLAYGSYGLYVMRAARKERALVRAAHGA